MEPAISEIGRQQLARAAVKRNPDQGDLAADADDDPKNVEGAGVRALAPKRKTVMGDNSIAVERLQSIVKRIERLEEEKKSLAGDIRDIYQEAKSAGFDLKVLRQLIRIRKQDAAEVEEQESLLDVYRRALGS